MARSSIGFRSGGRGYITKPRGEMHTMWNAGDVPARMIAVLTPGRFEHFFRELADHLDRVWPHTGHT